MRISTSQIYDSGALGIQRNQQGFPIQGEGHGQGVGMPVTMERGHTQGTVVKGQHGALGSADNGIAGFLERADR